YIVALAPPLLILDRLTVGLVTWLANREPRPGPATVRPQQRASLRWWTRGYQLAWVALLAVLLFAPLYASFVRSGGAGLIATSWTTQWYAQISPDFWSSVGLSVNIGLACIALSLICALPLALAWRFTALPAKNFLRSVVLVPVAVPGFLWGLSLLLL